ncbi:Lhr family helicase [Aeoliella mucimassa]|uniref:ATP-dependent DNA helicase RecQ n=1 Tax=Aeoliella mucimassa TaxID=2527972 RepID=A0A518AJA5_9BACT|nr:DEAD/DEAH box helicase [Aeoliella mucimassa]QDU54754.1 ATP-dependent DNA helicase RecQ [Aeoliella mucimassa]
MMSDTNNSAPGLASFHSITQQWFAQSFAAPTRAQQLAWPPIAEGRSTLLLAPTGSGKTLAAFLAAIDKIMFAAREASLPAKGKRKQKSKVRVLYISPLKALGVDVDRNLRSPIAGLRAVAEREQVEYHLPTVAVRSGDTPSAERARINREPPEILITTPESLYLMLTSKAREVLAEVETVIIDEIHVMVAGKRGAHLFVTLERLERLRRQANAEAAPLQRIGLSATQRPLEEIARLLGGAEATADPDRPARPRPVEIVDASEPKQFDLRVEVPVEDMARLGSENNTPAIPTGDASRVSNPPAIPSGSAAGPAIPSIWPAIHPRLVRLIREHRSTMIFVNSRRLAERLASAINELAEEEIALAHHGSVAKDKRADIEDRLKRGALPAIVATSSLELGIDMGAVDLVIQIEAPPSIASGMQRIGRAGHQTGATSKGILFPKYRGDLVAAAGATGRMLVGHVEETYYPRNPLDIVAQQIVAIVAMESLAVDDLYAMLRGAAPLADLPRSSFEGVLDLLAGRYPSDEFAELRPRIHWDRIAGTVDKRKSSQRIAVLNAGTIPDRGLYGVFLASDNENTGSRVGELDEEMVFETNPGDVFLLGASSWRVIEITRDRVIVVPAPGEPGRMPFWRGEGPGRPLEFGRAIGKLSRELTRMDEEEALALLQEHHALDRRAAVNLLRYLADQMEVTAEVPSDRMIVIESFLDEIGDWRVVVLSPFGARVHAPWAMAVAARLRGEGIEEVDYMWSDDGIVFRLPESDSPPPADWFVPTSDQVEDEVARQVGSTALFAARFRENAARSLLLPRRHPKRRMPLWQQRRRAADLLSVAAQYPAFPLLLETYREVLRDVFDLPGLVTLLRQVERREITVHSVVSHQASPFAGSLLFTYTGNFVYEGDVPLAERRAQALTLDHAQLRELLGTADLRELFDVEVIAELDRELQQLTRPVIRHPDDVHDLLLRLGPLPLEELQLRTDPEQASLLSEWITELSQARRVIEVRVAGTPQLAAAEDAGRLRDALGVNLPVGLPAAFLESASDPLGDLVSRHARTHGPFTAAAVAQRFGLGEAPILGVLNKLADRGRLVEGEFLPGGRGREWCDAEVLRTLKRRSLAKLRKQVEAVPSETLGRFLPSWHGLEAPRRGLDGLLDAIEILQGAPLPASTLESEILPARVLDYTPGDLDELCLAGEVVWRGFDALGSTDGRIALYLADRLPLLAPMVTETEELSNDPLVAQVRTLLAERGAIFFDELCRATAAFPPDLLSALWQLVWAGELTNDTLAPVRSLSRGRSGNSRQSSSRRRGRTFRSRRAARLPGSEGRWSLLPLSTEGSPSATERTVALAEQLVARHGVLTKNAVARESVPGGFAAIYPVLKQMEEAGKVRRGYFVAGLGGAQFAAPGADDSVRRWAKTDHDTQDDRAIMLAATDPANPYGAALPWPARDEATGRASRTAGASVLLYRGRLVGFISAGRSQLNTYLPDDPVDRAATLDAIAQALVAAAADSTPILLSKIDEHPVAASELAPALKSAGFESTSRGMLYRDTPKTNLPRRYR